MNTKGMNTKVNRYEITTFIKNKLSILFSKDNYVIFILLFVIILNCIEGGVSRAKTVDFVPINGDFQNYNVWRRFLDGQVPFKDFTVYLGTGHLLLGSILTYILGNNFKVSLIASYSLTLAIAAAIIIITSYLILRNLKYSMAIAASTIVLVKYKFTWFTNLIYTEFWTGLDAMLSPGNSARIIRGGVVVFVVGCILLSLFLIEKHLVNQKKSIKLFLQITITAIISGIGVLYSNDIGVASYICLSFVYFLFLIKNFRSVLMIIKYTVYYIVISIIALISGVLLITQGNISSWLNFTFSAGDYQRWYYGLSESWKSYYLQDLRFTPLYFLAFFIILINIYRFFKDKEANNIAYRLLTIYMLSVGLVSSYLYHIIAGGYSIELLSLITFSAIISYLLKWLCEYDKFNKSRFFIIIVLFTVSFTVLRVYTTYIEYRESYSKGIYIEGLDGNLSEFGEDINNILEYTGEDEIFSTYASAVEAVKGDFQPTGTDYIIHVLGDKAREDYLNKFLEGNYKYVQTINRDYTDWELWAESSNWFFYKELYKKYSPQLTTSYSIIWEPTKTDNIIKDDVSVNIERISNSEYKITCISESKTSALVDLEIGYNSKFNQGFLNNGVYAKYVHITDITRDDIYKSEKVNYFIPSNSEGYNIPITLQNGVGEVLISSYPNKETLLDITGVKVKEVIKLPFKEPKLIFQASDLTDTNWNNGVSTTSNTILFSNTRFNQSELNGAISLKSGDKVANIISVEMIDNWIHVNIDGNKESFLYPNKIEVIKK